jgi:hypothetical protein
VNYVNGLAVLRRISPSRALEDRLDAEGWLIAIDTGSGKDRKTIMHFDDEIPRDWDISKAITGIPDGTGGMVGGCTDGWSLVDEEGNIRGYFSSVIRAEEARRRAKVTIITDIELEDEESEKKTRSKPRADEPVAVSA